MGFDSSCRSNQIENTKNIWDSLKTEQPLHLRA